MGEKVLFLGLKNGGNRVLFSNLATGGAAVAPPPLPRLAPPPLRERQAAPARAPGLPRGRLASPPRQKPPSRPVALSSTGPAPTARPGWETLPARLSPLPGRPGVRKARPGPQRARAGRAAPQQARSPPGRASRESTNMAPSVTQPPPPSLAAGHTHTRSSGKDPGGRGAQSLFAPTSPPSPDGRGGPRAPKS